MGLRGPVAGIQPFAEISRRATTVVYKGYDSSLDRFVLLKVLRPEFAVHEDIAARFRSEARLLARVTHPHVVAVYAYGEDDGVTYMTTEFVDGQTLSELLEVGPPPAEIVAAIMLRIALGLAASHAEGVLHRDLKPDNILVSDKGQVKLTDFGLAVSEEARADGPAIAGTLSYMAPEIIGGGPPTPSSDLFAAGTVLFELLTGRTAFPGQSDSEILDGVLNKSPMHGVESFSDAPPGLLVLCNRLLQKEPEKRMSSAVDLSDALEGWLSNEGHDIAENDIAVYLADPSGWLTERREAPAADISEVAPATRAEPVRSPHRPRILIWSAAAIVAAIILGVWLTRTQESATESAVGADSSMAQASSDTLRDLPGETSISADPQEGSVQTADNRPTTDDEQGTLDPSSPATDTTDQLAANSPVIDSVLTPAAAGSGPIGATGTGRLAVALSPWASIWIDGDSVTTASIDTLQIPAGRHEVILRNPDFPDLRRSVDLAPDAVTKLEISLWSTVARLSLQVVPWAAVEVDGAIVDTIPPQVRPIILAPGPHTLRLLHPEYGEIQRDMVLQAGEHRELAYNMRDASRR